MTDAATARPALPVARTWPVLGCLPELIRRKESFWAEAHRRHGDIFRLDLGVTDLVALNHPRHAQHVLIENARNYRDKGGATGFRATLLPLTGQGLSTIDVEDAHWRSRRDLVGPAFRQGALKAMTDHMAQLVSLSCDAWPVAPGGTATGIDVVPQVSSAVTTSLAELLYGAPIMAHEMRRVARAFDRIMNYMWVGMLASAVPPWLPFPGRWRQRQAIEVIEGVVLDVVARRDRSRSRPELLDIMTAVEGELDAEGLRDEAVSLLLGAEPLAISVSWALHLLARHPEIQHTAVAELDRVLAGRCPRFEDLAALPYLRMVLKEALRLCPPTYWVQRRAAHEDVIDGVAVPAGTIVVVFIHRIHAHPEVWEAPGRFDPERFAPQRSASRHRQAWIPFGTGRRGCVAREFSMTLGQLILAQALQRYTFTPHPRHTPVLTVAANLRPRAGVWLSARRRAAA
ncbi:putative cytochrome P450 [Streptomyces sp. NBRC 110611]|uniref:cytochrome P450 n=1 Tax=Streptomyces sp. NBRC 110611 TaxID=1621259 RepID=UPI000829C8DD|nr:cytochrome P450 [Streptomyces sp. NBRC 110611]GAU65950.1 putative cytochrome P450 [Streptomyces sp. NBRC 110611]